jgi:hypothetical protein
LLEKQPNGEKGILLTNERTNIFHIKYGECKSYILKVFWNDEKNGWYIIADSSFGFNGDSTNAGAESFGGCIACSFTIGYRRMFSRMPSTP